MPHRVEIRTLGEPARLERVWIDGLEVIVSAAAVRADARRFIAVDLTVVAESIDMGPAAGPEEETDRE